MSKLQDFLNKNSMVSEETTEVPLSNRFVDESGELLKFKIKAIPMSVYKSIQKECTKTNPKKGTSEIDVSTLYEKLVIEGTVDPNFKDKESIESSGISYSINAPSQYLNKVLKSGEIIKLSDEILTLSGFNNSMEDLVEEAKN